MQNNQTILITGGTGLVGTALARHAITLGYHVIILTRQKNKPSRHPLISYAYWNVENGEIDEQALLKADAIIHLAGAGVAEKRWTKKYKQEIRDSRVNGGKLLTEKIKSLPHHIHTFISSSAIGFYGPDKMNDKLFEETDSHHTDFLGKTCKAWEESVQSLEQSSVRLCIIRTGIVLTPKGGALKEFIKPINMGIVPILGSGHQIISWIHIDDLCRMFLFLLEHKNLKGIFNGVSSEPASNKSMMKTLASVMNPRVKIFIPVPAFLLKIILGESSIEVLKSTSVSNNKIQRTGFVFEYPKLQGALTNLLR